MSKKKKLIATVAILLAIVISFVGGQTFAKYVTEITGEGNASIAAWNFAVTDDEDKQIQTINLASTIDNETLVDNKIAPGTKGSFVIKIDGRNSDVGVKYDIEITNETAKPMNLTYTYNGVTYNSLSEIATAASGHFDANASNKEKLKEINVVWEWPYEKINGTDEEKETYDEQDTTDATNITNYTFDINVTGTQIEPNV